MPMKSCALAFTAILALAAPALAGEPAPAPTLSQTELIGASSFAGEDMLKAFHGRDGIDRVVDRFVDRNLADARIADIFMGQDIPNLRSRLKEYFCVLLGGACTYTGKDMKTAHTDMGIQTADFNAVVENLQHAMDAEGVPFRTQNKVLAKLAPMKRKIVER